MPVIDADTHVIENEQTWQYFDEGEGKHMPVLVTPVGESSGREFWMIDGRRTYPKRSFDEKQARTPNASREMRDMEARLRHMDELGTDVQVLYPTMAGGFPTMTRRVDTERALVKCYNRWMADIWAKGEGRFRWVVVLPWHGDEIEDVRQAQRAEMEFGKQNGACGVLMFGGYGNRHFSDPMFAPLFEEASRLDLPICIHAGSANVPSFNEAYQGDGDIFPIAKIPGMTAFHLLVYHNVSAKFPSLRWGFLELGASWLPYLLTDLPNRFKKLRDGQELDRYTLLRDRRIWVQCQTDEDIPYILKYAGDDNLLVGSDYGHADTSSELEALQIVKERGIKGEIDPIAAQKMLDDNARAFYGI